MIIYYCSCEGSNRFLNIVDVLLGRRLFQKVMATQLDAISLVSLFGSQVRAQSMQGA